MVTSKNDVVSTFESLRMLWCAVGVTGRVAVRTASA